MLKVSCAIIIDEGRVFTARQGPASDHPLKWEFPGGKIHEYESAAESVLREIQEELDIRVEIVEPMIAEYHDYGFKQIELIPFLCIIKSGRIKLQEHVESNWVTIEELDYVDFAEADRLLIENKTNLQILKKYVGENIHNDG